MPKPTKVIHARTFTTDVFTIPFKDGYILYIPEAGLVAGVNHRVHDIVQAIKQNKLIEDNDFNRELVSILEKLRVFAPKPDHRSHFLEEYRPSHVTLSLTSRCHLRCVYCYARAGENISDMDKEIMEAALLFVADNAVWKKENAFIVSFHGEGEPTANWPLFRQAVIQSQQLARERKLEVNFTMSSNGIWGRSQREFIADHFKHLSISFDGPPEIQNLQRPTASGAPSFSIVFDNLKFLEEKGVEYGIRATVLPNGLESMIPFLELVATRLKCSWVHFEPVFLTGRAVNDDLDEANTNSFFRRFVDEYHRTVARGSEIGIHVAYSGCRASHYSANFCNVSGPNLNFFVSTRGIVSSCYEIIDPVSPKGRFTVYGYYDLDEHRFIFDQQKLQRLRNFGVDKIAHCRDCFARWNCSGDCFARSDVYINNDGEIVASQESPRCHANRKTTLRDLVCRGLVMDVLSRTNSPSIA